MAFPPRVDLDSVVSARGDGFDDVWPFGVFGDSWCF